MRYLVFIVYSTAVVYCFGRLIERLRQKEVSEKKLKLTVAAGLVLNIGMLAVVKYSSIFFGALSLLGIRVNGLEILFPLGISFYTFQSSGYLLDVYWCKSIAEKNPFKFALFVSFFPQIMQGPIGSFNRLGPQLFGGHRLDGDNIIRGIERITVGLAKKMIIADWAGIFVDAIWNDPDTYGGIVLIGLLLYGIELYADFSGAMDVVIGIARLFGIRLDENFRRPYLATSMADFWKRWHITLGDWMMNYVFYPVSLSGWMMKVSKLTRKHFGKKIGRTIPIAIADFIVFFLVGIWHGASLKYAVYGLLNGGIIAFSELMAEPYKKCRKLLHISGRETRYHIFAIIRTFIIVNLRWFYDRSDSLAQGNYLVRQAFTRFDPGQLLQISAGNLGTGAAPMALIIIAAGCVVMVAIGILQERGTDIWGRLRELPFPAELGIVLLLFVLIGVLGPLAQPRGFIYAQF